jgi:hypothetical protein
MDERQYSGTLTTAGDPIAPDFYLSLDSSHTHYLHMTDELETIATQYLGQSVTVLGIMDSADEIIDVSALWPVKPRDIESGL